MKKYVFIFSYDGTDYCGWQRQPELPEKAPSIQETVEKALESIAQEKVSIVASGRTDSGVHALAQVAHFVLKEREWDTGILFRAMNSKLPTDIRVIRVFEAPIEFHAQRSAISKQYSYYFQQGPESFPQLDRYAWWIRKQLDVSAMSQGLSYLVGQHDFKPFQSTGGKPMNTVRTILEADIRLIPSPFPFGFDQFQRPAPILRIRIKGTGFLKQMVRGITGTLLQVGEGRRPPECFLEILETKDRQKVGPTARGKGLWLERVWYGDPFGDISP